MLSAFALLLVPSVEARPLENDIFADFEETVKLRYDCVIFLFVGGAGVRGGEDSVCFLAETV